MALIALRNHGLLSHWVLEAVVVCVGVVGMDADGDADIDIDSIDADDAGNGRATALYCMEDAPADTCNFRGNRKRYIETESAVEEEMRRKMRRTSKEKKNNGVSDDNNFNDSNSMDNDSNAMSERRAASVSVLLQFYDLCEVMDVEDDLMSSEKRTQSIFKRRYIHPLCALPCLAASIRTRNRDLDGQAYQNRSSHWEGDNIHFSYTRDSTRDGPFDPRRDRESAPPGRLGEDCPAYSLPHAPYSCMVTTHVLKVDAISSSESFHADFDPKSLRRRQLIELYG